MNGIPGRAENCIHALECERPRRRANAITGPDLNDRAIDRRLHMTVPAHPPQRSTSAVI